MKRHIYILLIFLSGSVMAQPYRGRYTGKDVTPGGWTKITISADDIPTPPDTPEPTPPTPDDNDITFPNYVDSIWCQTFEETPLNSQYDHQDMVQDFSIGTVTPTSYSVGLGPDPYDHEDQYNVSIIDVPELDGGTGIASRALKINFEAGKYGIMSVGPEGGGAIWQPRIPQGNTEIMFSYNLMRNEGALLLREAKIPCIQANFSWSNNEGARINSIMCGAASSAYYHKLLPTIPTGSITSGDMYLNEPDNYTENFEWDWTDSTWYNIAFRVSLNDVGYANGIIEVFIDGKLSNSVTGLELIESGTFDQLEFHWFHGGGDISYALPSDQFLIIDDISLFNYQPGHGPGPREASSSGRVLEWIPGWNISEGKKEGN